jgi:hypothetical protein
LAVRSSSILISRAFDPVRDAIRAIVNDNQQRTIGVSANGGGDDDVMVMTMTRIISSSPTVARVGVTGPVCIRIELSTPARIVNYVLRGGRGDKRE